MDRFREMTVFVAVVEAGGFSAAARRIGQSQSSMSKALIALEGRLGVQLLIRSTRSVSLTERGQKFYDQVKPLLDAMARAESGLPTNLNRAAR